MTKKRKLLILSLFLCLSMLCTLGMESKAEAMSEEQTTVSGLQDENVQRLEEVTGMDTSGNIYEVDDTDGSVEEAGARARTVSVQVVNFNTKGNAVTAYKEYLTGASGYTNGAYGADAAYLGTYNGKVRFMMSGVVGEVNAGEVQVADLSSVKVVSCYEVSGGRLIHRIVHDMTTPGYASSLDNGPAPSYLKSGTTYYSYDGHYFYTDYSTMLADYQKNSRSQSVNAGSPYYNYYQYLPFRSKTAYSAGEINALLNAKTSSGSKLRNTGSSFISNQETYGVNALIMTAIAANESGWGTSNICKNKNNLFGLNAVDSLPSASANAYSSVGDCIRQFAETYMSKRYLRPGYKYYNGGFLGNKASGINVSYGSDPYWGEKAANILWNLDKNGGSKDYGAYTIGIKSTVSTSHTSVNVRSGSSASTASLYMTGDKSSYAVLILNPTSENGFYKILSDGVLNVGRSALDSSTGNYDDSKMYAYISSDYVTIVSRRRTIETPEVKKELQSIMISKAPTKTDYTEGEKFDVAGMTVKAQWSDGTETDVSKEVEVITDVLDVGSGSVTISYTCDGITKTAEQKITVKEKVTKVKPEEPDAGYRTDMSEPGTDKPGTDTPGESQPEENNPTTDVPLANKPDTSTGGGAVQRVSDETTGIWVNGIVKADAVLTVEKMTEASEAYGTYVEPVKNCTILGVYDINLSDELSEGESVELGFPVDERYNGQEVIILHYTSAKGDDEAYMETHTSKVENGAAVMEVSGFSPYVLALDDGEEEHTQGSDTTDRGIPDDDKTTNDVTPGDTQETEGSSNADANSSNQTSDGNAEKNHTVANSDVTADTERNTVAAKTGDESSIFGWSVFLALSIIAIMFVLIRKKHS